MVEGDRVEGTWRPIFIRNGGYHLTDLFIYADGAIHCWEWVDLDGLRRKIEEGWVATRLEPGGRASAHHLATWRFEDPHLWISAEELIGEVADEIDRLRGRPDSTDRCMRALDRFLRTRAEDDRLALREAYEAIPGHLRTYALGDMDYGDAPLRMLAAHVGEPAGYLRNLGDGDEEVVTEELRQRAFAYFADRDHRIAEYEDTVRRRPADGPRDADAPPVHLNAVMFPQGWPDDPGVLALRNECPAPIAVAGAGFPDRQARTTTGRERAHPVQPPVGADHPLPLAREPDPNTMDEQQHGGGHHRHMTRREPVERRMRGDALVRCRGRARETGREKSRNRAPVRPLQLAAPTSQPDDLRAGAAPGGERIRRGAIGESPESWPAWAGTWALGTRPAQLPCTPTAAPPTGHGPTDEE
jgi:hypothetical protein